MRYCEIEKFSFWISIFSKSEFSCYSKLYINACWWPGNSKVVGFISRKTRQQIHVFPRLFDGKEERRTTSWSNDICWIITVMERPEKPAAHVCNHKIIQMHKELREHSLLQEQCLDESRFQRHLMDQLTGLSTNQLGSVQWVSFSVLIGFRDWVVSFTSPGAKDTNCTSICVFVFTHCGKNVHHVWCEHSMTSLSLWSQQAVDYTLTLCVVKPTESIP